jgi:hypothetical protein
LADNGSLLTPLYAIHPPHTLACASILLTTRLLRIPLPSNWHILFDVEYDDIWSCCGMVMRLWEDWGLAPPRGAMWSPPETADARRARENRWRRAWILSQGKKAVRRWVEERDKDEGDGE